jgi:radical SAM protein (TIGR01212 family)
MALSQDELLIKDKLAVGSASSDYPGPFYEERFFMQHYYGKALHKVPVDFNYGCPHRTPEHHGGCTFCPEDGSRATQIDGIDELGAQIKAAINFAKQRYGASSFTAYVQAYTATFAPVSKFREKIKDILQEYPFDALHLGTRPDCLPVSTLDFLEDLSERIDLWVELGLQTVHDKSLERIVRGHDWACSLKGIEKLKSRGLNVISHVILGLPGETREDMLETAKVMGSLPIDGIKVHNLHVLEKTQLAVEYREQPFPMLSELEYIELLSEFMRYLPPGLPVMRINTDTPPKELVAPHWQVKKGQLREFVVQHMDRMGYRQGDLLSESLGDRGVLRSPKLSDTMDGSFTLISEKTGEAFHPRVGAETSMRESFIQPSQVSARLLKGDVRLLDVGFGTGTLSRLAFEVQRELKSEGRSCGELQIDAFERDRKSSHVCLSHHPTWFAEVMKASFDEEQDLVASDVPLKIWFGDARWHLQKIEPGSVDLIYLDPFDEKNNAELVSVELFALLKHLLKKDGALLVSSSRDSVVVGLQRAGFSVVVEKGKGVCTADLRANGAESPQITLPRQVPFRDPYLCWGHKDIVRRRGAEQTELRESTQFALKR